MSLSNWRPPGDFSIYVVVALATAVLVPLLLLWARTK